MLGRRLGKQKKILQAFGVVIGVAILGVALLKLSHAATPALSLEAEAGTLSAGATTVSDQAASGGRAVSFVADSGIPAGAIDAKNYGTVGNGTTNDTKALQAAADAASGKTLYIEPGTYLTSGLTINGPTQILANGVTFKAASGASMLLEIQKSTTVTGIDLDGNGTGTGGIHIPGISNVTVSGCHLNNIKNDPAVDISDSSNVTISGCSITGSGGDAIDILNTTNSKFLNNTVTNSGGHGMEWWGGDSANPQGPNGVSGLTFDGNTVTNSTGGAAIWGSMGQDITITNNSVTECGDVCIDPEGGTNIKIQNNHVHNGDNGGITVFYGATYVEISNNTVVQDSGYGNGIMIYGTFTSKNISILNNNVTTNGSDGIFTLHGVLSNSTITGNTITLQGGGTGVNIDGGSGNTIANNTVH